MGLGAQLWMGTTGVLVSSNGVIDLLPGFLRPEMASPPDQDGAFSKMELSSLKLASSRSSRLIDSSSATLRLNSRPAFFRLFDVDRLGSNWRANSEIERPFLIRLVSRSFNFGEQVLERLHPPIGCELIWVQPSLCLRKAAPPKFRAFCQGSTRRYSTSTERPTISTMRTSSLLPAASVSRRSSPGTKWTGCRHPSLMAMLEA